MMRKNKNYIEQVNNEQQMAQSPELAVLRLTKKQENEIMAEYRYLVSEKLTSYMGQLRFNGLPKLDQIGVLIIDNARKWGSSSGVEMAQNPGLRNLGFTKDQEMELIDQYRFLISDKAGNSAQWFVKNNLPVNMQKGLQVLDMGRRVHFPSSVVEMAHNPGLRNLGLTRDQEEQLIVDYDYLIENNLSQEEEQLKIAQLPQMDQMGLQVLDTGRQLSFPNDVVKMAEQRELRDLGFTRVEELQIEVIRKNINKYFYVSDKLRYGVKIINNYERRTQEPLNHEYNIMTMFNGTQQQAGANQAEDNRLVQNNNAVQNNQPEQNNEGENNQPEQNNNAGQNVLPRRNNQLVQNNSQGQINQQTYPDSARASRYSTTISTESNETSASYSQHSSIGSQ
ncbi:MAG: hypothetical protein K5769_00590 [Pseudobutyrivibrio sp.]|nr:hypothetical protein [Pseudobutyrivibrio sp.]